MMVGDILLAYVANIHVFVGLLRVVDKARVNAGQCEWDPEDFPVVVPVATEVVIALDSGINVKEIVAEIPRMREASERAPGAWGNFVRGSPRPWPSDEAHVVMSALRQRAEAIGPGRAT